MQYIPLITLALVVVLLVLVIVLLLRKPAAAPRAGQRRPGRRVLRTRHAGHQNLKQGREAQRQQLADMDKSLTGKMGSVTDQLGQFERRLHGLQPKTTQNLENIRTTVDKNLRAMQEDNNKKLDDMRRIVDEKLQKTLSERMNESFRLVNERLEQVYKGLARCRRLRRVWAT